MSKNITLMGASYTAVPAVQLPQTGGGTALFTDVSDTTAIAADVASGKYFYLATGEKVEGTGGGGARTIIVPEQTLNVSTSYTQITNYNKLFEEGEEYICTVNGVEYTKTAVAEYGSINIHIDGWDIYFERTSSDNMFFDVENSAKYGTYTIKVEQESGGGGGGSTLIEKAITANGTYDASDDSADGYSKVTVNVSGGSSKNVQVADGMNMVNTTSYTAVSGQSIEVAVAGTYDVYWTGYRSSTSGTSGTQLYINETAHGTAQTSFSNNGQSVHLTGVSLAKNDVVAVYARARGTQYYMYAGDLTIVQTS